MYIKNSKSALVGFVLGIVWLIIGFSYNNSGIMMFGGLMLCFGLFFKFKKEPAKNSLNEQPPVTKKQKVLR